MAPARRGGHRASVPQEEGQGRPVGDVIAGKEVSLDALSDHLAERVPKKWLPDRYEFVEVVPRTTTATFDENVLQDEFREQTGPLVVDV